MYKYFIVGLLMSSLIQAETSSKVLVPEEYQNINGEWVVVAVKDDGKPMSEKK